MNKLEQAIAEHRSWMRETGRRRAWYLALALCGETGELANLFKKEWRGDGDKTDKIKGEIADVGIYLYMLADELGINMTDVMCEKLAEVERRPHLPWNKPHD